MSVIMLVSLLACERKDTDIVASGEDVSLEITFSVPEIAVSTRGIDDPWDDDLSDWTAWDRFTDGRDLYEVTILLIEEATGNLVGFRDMYASSDYTDEDNGFWDGSAVMDQDTESGKSAKFSFLYDKPQGGRTIEKLRRGRYQILAVSNYRPISAENTGKGAYSGLIGAIGSSSVINTPFTELIEKIEDAFDPTDGIPDFKNTTMYSDIWTFNIVTDDNHLCHKQPQPLTAVHYIELTPGLNKVDIDLERTYVRVRVEIENNSGQEMLTVNDFDFCNWFTQRAVYLFNDPTDNSRNYDISSSGLNTYKKSPILEKECDGRVATEPGDKPSSYSYQNSAIVSFKEAVEIAPGGSKVIFDGYIFGSKLGTDPGDGDTYQYHLDVEYKNVSNYNNGYYMETTTPITSIEDFRDHYAGGGHLFVIQSQHTDRGRRFLTTDALSSTTLSAMTLDNVLAEIEGVEPYRYVFELQSTGTEDTYRIKTLGTTPYWFGALSYGVMPSLNNISGADYVMLENTNNGVRGLVLGNSGYYLNSMNNTGGAWNGIDLGSQFQMYPVSGKGVGTPHLSSNIDLMLIDPVTAAVYPVQNIKRNDFINVLVSVAYNDMDSSFDITAVTGWTDKDEQVEFH